MAQWRSPVRLEVRNDHLRFGICQEVIKREDADAGRVVELVFILIKTGRIVAGFRLEADWGAGDSARSITWNDPSEAREAADLIANEGVCFYPPGGNPQDLVAALLEDFGCPTQVREDRTWHNIGMLAQRLVGHREADSVRIIERAVARAPQANIPGFEQAEHHALMLDHILSRMQEQKPREYRALENILDLETRRISSNTLGYLRPRDQRESKHPIRYTVVDFEIAGLFAGPTPDLYSVTLMDVDAGLVSDCQTYAIKGVPTPDYLPEPDSTERLSSVMARFRKASAKGPLVSFLPELDQPSVDQAQTRAGADFSTEYLCIYGLLTEAYGHLPTRQLHKLARRFGVPWKSLKEGCRDAYVIARLFEIALDRIAVVDPDRYDALVARLAL